MAQVSQTWPKRRGPTAVVPGLGRIRLKEPRALEDTLALESRALGENNRSSTESAWEVEA